MKCMVIIIGSNSLSVKRRILLSNNFSFQPNTQLLLLLLLLLCEREEELLNEGREEEEREKVVGYPGRRSALPKLLA